MIWYMILIYYDIITEAPRAIFHYITARACFLFRYYYFRHATIWRAARHAFLFVFTLLFFEIRHLFSYFHFPLPCRASDTAVLPRWWWYCRWYFIFFSLFIFSYDIIMIFLIMMSFKDIIIIIFTRKILLSFSLFFIIIWWYFYLFLMILFSLLFHFHILLLLYTRDIFAIIFAMLFLLSFSRDDDIFFWVIFSSDMILKKDKDIIDIFFLRHAAVTPWCEVICAHAILLHIII